MKTAFVKGWKWLLGVFMGILGLSGCAKIFPFRCEYGCPNADFKLVGNVKDANGKGIERIRVVFRPDRSEEDSPVNDTPVCGVSFYCFFSAATSSASSLTFFSGRFVT